MVSVIKEATSNTFMLWHFSINIHSSRKYQLPTVHFREGTNSAKNWDAVPYVIFIIFSIIFPIPSWISWTFVSHINAGVVTTLFCSSTWISFQPSKKTNVHNINIHYVHVQFPTIAHFNKNISLIKFSWNFPLNKYRIRRERKRGGYKRNYNEKHHLYHNIFITS